MAAGGAGCRTVCLLSIPDAEMEDVWLLQRELRTGRSVTRHGKDAYGSSRS